MATSVVAYGKLSVAMDKGEPIPESWALDDRGNPTTDPHHAAALCPTGGYKGSGLALMFECLSSLIVGIPLLVPALLGLDRAPAPGTQNGVVAAIDIGALTDINRYKEDVDQLVKAIKALPKAEGIEEILVPGEPEEHFHQSRVREGIPLPMVIVHSLRQVAAELHVELPTAIQVPTARI
jgi:ureidoglycolate dehydrogenase (NAD+)